MLDMKKKEDELKNWQTRNTHAISAKFRNSAGAMKSVKRSSRSVEKKKAINEFRDK